MQAEGHDDPGWGSAGMPPLGLFEDLRGRRAVVTGAARGIGEAIAKWLIMAGADVTVVDKNARRLEEAFCTESCRVVRGDLYDGDVEGLADELTRGGPMELVVNNVGVTEPGGCLDMDSKRFQLVLGTNLEGPWLFTSRLVKALLEDQARTPARSPRRHGSLLFISSLHDTFVPKDSLYGVSKAGVAMLAKAMAKELAAHGIRVNAISPGWIRTAEDTTTPEQVAKYARLRPRIPAGQAGVPGDVARVALFLLSDAWSGYVTGQNLAVDGGLSLHNWQDD